MRRFLEVFFFWVFTGAIVLLLCVSPAHAVVDSVAPTSAGSFRSDHYQNKPSPLAVCQTYNSTYNWVQTRFPPVVSLTIGYCSPSGWLVYYVAAGTCPVADPVYTYNAVNQMCERTLPDPPSDPCAGVSVTQNFSITSACLSSAPGSPTCAPDTIAHACGVLVKSIDYDCVANAAGTVCAASYGSSLEPLLPAPGSPAVACMPGQSLVTGSGGFSKCYADSSGAIASAVAAASTLAADRLTDSMTQAASAASAVGGDGAGVVAAGAVAAGGFSGSGRSSGGSFGGQVLTKNADVANLCADDPANPLCRDNKGAAGVSTGAVSGLYTPGVLNEGKTFGGSVDTFKGRVLSSGVGAAAGGFFTVNQAAGACPVWSADVPMFGNFAFDFYCTSTFQNLLPWIRAVLLLIFSVVAFRIAIL